jgi:hypothetical protein
MLNGRRQKWVKIVGENSPCRATAQGVVVHGGKGFEKLLFKYVNLRGSKKERSDYATVIRMYNICSGEDMVTAITRTCRNCGYSYQPCKNDNVKSCPQCGGECWDGSLQVSGGAYTELEVTALNNQGQIEGKRIKKTDLNTSANLSADLGNPSKISIVRKKRLDRVGKFEEEGAAAEALVDSFNKKHGTHYEVEKKCKEDSDYIDRAFVSKNDKRDRIYVQIRHLDTQIVAEVQKGLTFDGERTAADIILSIRDAIDAKADVDREIKPKTILQLMLLAPLGMGIRQAIEESRFDFKGFKEVWISPFHEESFPLNSL